MTTKTKTQAPAYLNERLGRWSDLVSVLFVEKPQVFECLPEDFVLVTLPQEEPALSSYALSLVPAQPDKPVIYALVSKASVTFLLPQGPLQASLELAPKPRALTGLGAFARLKAWAKTSACASRSLVSAPELTSTRSRLPRSQKNQTPTKDG